MTGGVMTERASHPKDHSSHQAGEFFTPERCWILESWNTSSDPAVSIARARVEVGVQTQLHRLRGVDERYLIVDGAGELELGGAPDVEVRPGDIVMIPGGTSQRIRNVGEGNLIFYCICSPRFEPECYETLENNA
jgi:mannose-6-phosphate isomerase-like protein (cupin superfamily)